MIKKMSIRKISITTMALLLTVLLYLFPINNNDLKVKESVTYYDESNYKSVYLMDKYNYVSKLKLPIETSELESIVKEKLEYLIVNSEKEGNIPNGFRAVIPVSTKILNVSFENGVVTINFSKELLNTNLNDEEHMIEAIVFTLTEIEKIESVVILVESSKLNNLPNSKKTLPEKLDRSYGINKIYDFDSLIGLTKTTIYYVNEINDEKYYTPVTKITNDEREKVTVIIEELKSSIILQSNLSSYLNTAAELDKYEIIEDRMILSFNDKIFESNNNILEEVEYTISMSIMDNYDVNEVVIKVGDKELLNKK